MRPGADRGPQEGSEEVPGTLSCALYLLLAALSQSLGGLALPKPFWRHADGRVQQDRCINVGSAGDSAPASIVCRAWQPDRDTLGRCHLRNLGPSAHPALWRVALPVRAGEDW